MRCLFCVFFFFFQAEDGIRDLTVTGVQTCDLPICTAMLFCGSRATASTGASTPMLPIRSEEHTSELQSQSNLVCRLLLEKKKNIYLFLLLTPQAVHIRHLLLDVVVI